MADGGAQPNRERGADLTTEEQQRRRALSDAQSKEYVRQRMAGAGLSALPPARAKKEDAQGMGYVDEGGEIPSTDRMRETLARNQASSSLAQGAGGGGMPDVDKEIQKQTNAANHYLVIEILPQLFAFDASCFFLTTIVTMPIYFFIIVVYLGSQLKNGFTGNKSLIPYFPELTWESFAPPGTQMSVPLPKMILYVLTLWAILLLLLASTVWAGIIMLAVQAMTDPLGTINSASELFPFFSGVGGA